MTFRLDRVLTLYCFHPLSRLLKPPHRIPILMYHGISDTKDPRHPYYHTTTSPGRFVEQMRYLAQHHYTPVSISQALRLLQSPNQLRPVVLTFDDGYTDFYSTAYPVLASYNFTASMFLPTALIQDKPSTVNGNTYLTWAQVRELCDAGFDFGSHTVSHARLVELTSSQVKQELLASKNTIEDKLGTRVTSFSYPFAFPEAKPAFVCQLRDHLMACGYEVGVSTILGSASLSHDPYFLPRIPVNGADDSPLFRAKLQGGYDWLHQVQHLKKIINEYSSTDLPIGPSSSPGPIGPRR
jgi:peptidoglycan/xylan/chitin deacetylase (PgdA/CDA1 family)